MAPVLLSNLICSRNVLTATHTESQGKSQLTMTSKIMRCERSNIVYYLSRNYLVLKAEVKLYVSTKGNDQYVLSPMKIPRGPLCGKANDEYRKFLMEELSKTSDLPNSDAADICPLFEKVI